MITLRRPSSRSGFTLVELAIVLAVAGVLIVGLWRLLSGGNQQLKDSSVASQQRQVISMVKSYLNTADGQSYMAARGSNVNDVNVPLPLPAANNTNAACRAWYTANFAAFVQLPSFCDYIPTGFTSATLNAYGQTFLVNVQVRRLLAPGTPPTSYSIMVLTQGGDVIPDSSGGRISSGIGADGGFIYSAPVCTAAVSATTACGSYGSWQATINGAPPGYGFAALPGVGHVASRTYASSSLGSTDPWLARLLMPSDTGTPDTPVFNTMTTDFLMGGRNMYLAANRTALTGGGRTFLQQGGLTDNNSIGDSLVLFPNGAYLSGNAVPAARAYLRLSTGCSVDASTATAAGLFHPAGDAVGNAANDCQNAVQITGDQNVIGLLQATSLFSGTFIYQASDRRLKEDIRPIEHALETLGQMKPVSFKFKANGSESLGFIAQEVEQVYPQLVNTPGNPEAMKSVNYEGLIAPLVSAVQELKKQNDELREQLAKQTERQQKLEAAINKKK